MLVSVRTVVAGCAVDATEGGMILKDSAGVMFLFAWKIDKELVEYGGL